jgi:quercetin dioxygenase-like cupin family protein
MSVVVDRTRGLVSTIGGSTYVKLSEMDWKPTRFEKVSIKVLYEDPERGEMTCLLKLEPGAHIPFHKHPEIEQTLVL